jgi:hypothetical protein
MGLRPAESRCAEVKAQTFLEISPLPDVERSDCALNEREMRGDLPNDCSQSALLPTTSRKKARPLKAIQSPAQKGP